MDERLIVNASPHIRAQATTRRLMGNVLIALLPCVISAAYFFGIRSILVVLTTTASSIAFEYLYCLIMHKENSIGDLSACVTGVILALNMPSGMPLWICIVGSFAAIVVTKQLFGGLGYNFANPALVGRIVLFLGFSGRMTTYVFPKIATDSLASATVLAEGIDRSGISLWDVMLGARGGVMGETCALAILVGLIYLLATKTIEITIPASIMGTVFVLSLIADGGNFHDALIYVLSGGLLFGAAFMATDYVTSPFTKKGKLIFGFIIGLITFMIRKFGSMNEGVSYAILMGNLLVPWINKWGTQTPLGHVKLKKSKNTDQEKGGAK